MKCPRVLLPLLAVMLLALAACGSEGVGEDASAETTVQTEAPPTSTQLTNGGQAKYSIVRGDLAGNDLIKLMQSTAKELQTLSGAAFTVATDWVKRDTEPDSSTLEILFGKTNHSETLAVAKRVGYGGYGVAVDGNKVVVYGSTLDAQEKAAKAFLGALTTDDAGELTLNLPAGGLFDQGEALFFADGDAADYVIVAGESCDALAVELQTAIRKAYGYELPIHQGTDGESAREILIGECGRANTDAVISTFTSSIGYTVKIDGEKILLTGVSNFGTSQAVQYFINTYVQNEYAAVLQIPDGLEYSYVGLAGAEHVELTEGADIRIMSFNILAELWNDKLPVNGRDEIVAATILTYLPDVIGLQEVTSTWYKRLGPMIENKYQFVNQRTAENLVNYSGMAYNVETVKPIESGCELFSQGNSGNLRLMNWGLFETIAGGERFVVMNTHWDINNSTEPKNAYRLVQSGEMANRVLELQQLYNCPVIVTGDYNANRNTEEFKNYISISNTKDAQVDAAVRVNAEYISYHAVGVVAKIGDTSIDHITYTAGTEALFFKNFNQSPICDASDHNPIMADFVLE